MTEPSDMKIDIDVLRSIVRDMTKVEPQKTIAFLIALADQIESNIGGEDICTTATKREIETATAAIVAAYERAKA